MNIRSIRVWWCPEVDKISLGEFLISCAHEFCSERRPVVDLVVERNIYTTKDVLPDLNFRVTREDGKTIITRSVDVITKKD